MLPNPTALRNPAFPLHPVAKERIVTDLSDCFLDSINILGKSCYGQHQQKQKQQHQQQQQQAKAATSAATATATATASAATATIWQAAGLAGLLFDYFQIFSDIF